MANGGTGQLRPITINDVQAIIGRACIDQSFRDSLIKNPKEALESLGLRYDDSNVPTNARISPKDMIDGIVKILSDPTNRSIDDVFSQLRGKYEEGADGVIRPKCG